MTSAPAFLRTLLIYSICVPLAIFIGYFLAIEGWPAEIQMTSRIVASVLLLLCFPLFLKWHHVWVIITWNLGMVLFFLPGRPYLWMAMIWLSLGISTIQYILNRRLKFIWVPSIVRPLIFLAVVFAVTVKLTGGLGLNALGGEEAGGKKYIYIFCAIAGYFALSAQVIPPKRANFYVCIFFLMMASYTAGDLAPLFGPGGVIFFYFFPVSTTGLATLTGDTMAHTSSISRLFGLSVASTGVICALLARYGIRELFSIKRLRMLIIFLVFLFAGMLGGFRSNLIFFIAIFALLFYLEGLVRTPLLPVFLLITVLGGTLMIAFVGHMPRSVQRTLSFLPVDIDPEVRMSAETTTEWRVNMWKHVLPEVPQYLLLGKGYAFSAKDFQMASLERNFETDTATTELAGDYHSGPLSVVIPFGIWGVFGFIWFAVAGWRLLYSNYRYGHPIYRRLNAFLFAFYIAKLIFFIFIFGALNSDLIMFTGLIGLSVSLNNGVAKPLRFPQQVNSRMSPFRKAPAAMPAGP